MKLTYFIQQKVKLAMWLAGIMLIILLTNLVSKNNLESVDNKLNSIYHDRLIPARDIFYLSEHLHSKASLMDNFFIVDEEDDVEQLNERLALNNYKIDSLIAKFEKTYLVNEEQKSLSTLKGTLVKYENIEKLILHTAQRKSKEQAENIFNSKGKFILESAVGQLHELTNIQSKVGNDLMNESHYQILNTDSLSSLQIVIVILLGAFGYRMLLTSKIIERRGEKFHLN